VKVIARKKKGKLSDTLCTCTHTAKKREMAGRRHTYPGQKLE